MDGTEKERWVSLEETERLVRASVAEQGLAGSMDGDEGGEVVYVVLRGVWVAAVFRDREAAEAERLRLRRSDRMEPIIRRRVLDVPSVLDSRA